jgi:hypothetical protein
MPASRRARVLLWLAVALIPPLSACRAGARGPAATPTPTARQRLDAAVTRLDALSGFHFLLTHQNGASTIAPGLLMTRAEGDFAGPDRFSAKINASFQGLPAVVRVINVGDKTWITNPLESGDHYQPLPNGVQTAAIFGSGGGLIIATKAMVGAQADGNERLGNVDTVVVRGNLDAGRLQSVAADAQSGLPVATRVWIGRQDGLIYRIRIDGPLSPNEPKNIVRQVDLSQFDEKLDIEPPAGAVLDLPPEAGVRPAAADR